jgi:hypothetical protein
LVGTNAEYFAAASKMKKKKSYNIDKRIAYYLDFIANVTGVVMN